MLVLSRGPEEGIMIGDRVEVRVLEVRGDRVRLGIVAPSDVPVHRTEVFLSIQRENRAAAATESTGLDKALDLFLGLGGGLKEAPHQGPPGKPPPRGEGGRDPKDREDTPGKKMTSAEGKDRRGKAVDRKEKPPEGT